MKKILLSSSSLAASYLVLGGAHGSMTAQAADPISLSVGGYYESIISFVDQDDPPGNGFNEVNVRHEGEIHFNGETTLDNGLTVGFEAQLEVITQSDQIDETFLYFEGGWGRVNLGAENSAPFLMQYSAPISGLGLNSPNFWLFSVGTGAGTGIITAGYLNLAADANKITYFSPRFGGFQLGISYTPNRDSLDGNRQTFGLNTDEDPGDHNNIIGFGVNYWQDFENFSIGVSGGFEYADLEEEGPNSDDDVENWAIGATVEFSGFTLGGSYTDRNHQNDFENPVSELDDEWWVVGLQYASPAAWTIGITYSHAEADATGGGENERDHFEIGGSYKLGPGVKLIGSLQYLDQENENSEDVDGFGAAMGTVLSF